MIFELMKTEFHRLTAVVEKPSRYVPMACPGKALQRLSHGQRLLVPNSPPQPRIVVIAARFIWLIRLHLWFTEVLRTCKLDCMSLKTKQAQSHLDRPIEKFTGQGY